MIARLMRFNCQTFGQFSKSLILEFATQGAQKIANDTGFHPRNSQNRVAPNNLRIRSITCNLV